MKKRTRAPTRTAGAGRRRKVAGTRALAARPRGQAKVKAKPEPKPKAATKAATKPKAQAKANARAKAPAIARGKTKADRSPAIGQAETTIRRLKAELADVRKQMAELQASVETDFLLDILNRRGFERELNRSIAFIKRYHATAAVIMLDVDRLKPINDTFGHAAGDEVLKGVAAVLAGMVRASDVVGRLGGDEFAILLWNLNETDTRAKAHALEQAIDALCFTFAGRTVTAGASAGIAVIGMQSDLRRVLEEADRAMYVRKAQRRHEEKAAGERS